MGRNVFLDPAAKMMAARSREWPRTSSRPSCMTVFCPDCGRKGLTGGAWTASCAYHVTCHVCDAVLVERALERHLREHGISEPTAEQQAVRDARTKASRTAQLERTRLLSAPRVARADSRSTQGRAPL
jgi:ribosomal protein S27E